MGRRVGVGIIALGFAAAVMALPAAPAAAVGTTYHVNATSPPGNDANDCLSSGAPCATIQAAIDKAQAGDTVTVAAGIYVEDLVIDVAITLSGPNAAVAAGPGGPGLTLPARSAEAVVQATSVSGAKVTVDGVAIVGMKFIRPSASLANADVRALSNATAGIHTVVRNSIFDLGSGASRGCGSAISSTWTRADLATSFTLEANGFYNQTTASCSSSYTSRVIYLDSASPGSEIVDNHFSLASEVFVTDTADDVLIEGNYFASGGGAIVLGAIADAIVRDNVFGNPNGYGVYIDGATGVTDGNQHTVVEGNRFLNVAAGYLHIITSGVVGDLTVRGNTFVQGTTYAIGLGWSAAGTSAAVIANNDFQATQTRALWNCQATGTSFQLNNVASPGSSSAGVLQYKPVRNGHTTACGAIGGYALTATFDAWTNELSAAAPILNDTLSPPGSAWTSTIDPKLTTFTLDPARTGAPGWWPLTYSTLTTLPAVLAPQELSFDEPSLGSPTVEIRSAAAGSTVEVSRLAAEDLPNADAPFTVDGATLIDIEVSAGVTGPFLVCIDGAAPARLWHFEGGAWVDMTERVLPPASSLAPVPGKLCGMTATLSPFAVASPVPLVTYTGTTYTTDGTATLSAILTPAGCPGEVSFDLTPDPDGGDPAPRALSGGTASYVLSGLDAGLYEIVVTYAASDDACDDTGVQDTAVLVVVTAGGAANGGGWFRDADVTPPRGNFGFVIQRTYSGRTKTPTGYRGQFLLVNNEAWRLKSVLSGSNIYGTFSCPDGVGATGSGRVCASFTGSGMLQSWDPDLLGPEIGGWVDEEQVTFTVTVYDGGQIKVCKGKKNCSLTDVADWFGIEIDGWPSSLVPEGAPTRLVQPDGKGTIKASA